MTEEIWKTIIPEEQSTITLDVSNLGNVKFNGKLLEHHIYASGYPVVVVYYAPRGTSSRTFFVHRLLAQAFLRDGKQLGKLQTNHRDGVKTNLALSNLEILTAKQNINHAVSLGLIVKQGCCQQVYAGEKNGNAKLRTEDVLKIRNIAQATKRTYTSIGKEFNVHRTIIADIVNRVTWRHI